MPWEFFCFDFCFGTVSGAIILQQPMAPLIPAALACSMEQ
jgi:hypothetical protein